MKVFITGGTGYIGQEVVQTCLRRGHTVVVLARPNSQRAALLEGGEVVEGDLFAEDFLTEKMAACDAVIHLVGIIREQPRTGLTMDRVHFDGTMTVVQAAAQAQVKRFLHMSALGTRAQAHSKYHKSKWLAEEAVRRSGLEYTIFRPSVVFGPGGPGPNFIAQLTDLVTSGPVTPVVGNGLAMLQPVHVQTVAQAFCAALEENGSQGQTYDLGGPDVVSYIDILRKLAHTANRPLRPLYIPMRVMKAVTTVFGRMSKFPITMDQLIMLEEGNTCSDTESIYRDLKLERIPLSL